MRRKTHIYTYRIKALRAFLISLDVTRTTTSLQIENSRNILLERQYLLEKNVGCRKIELTSKNRFSITTTCSMT
jgi:hypothetical protein